jgi:hypothetical protein
VQGDAGRAGDVADDLGGGGGHVEQAGLDAGDDGAGGGEGVAQRRGVG